MPAVNAKAGGGEAVPVASEKAQPLMETGGGQLPPKEAEAEAAAHEPPPAGAAAGSSKASADGATVLCLPIGAYSRSTQFLLTSSVVVALFLLYGYFQELIFRLEGFRPFGWYLTLIQFAYYTIFGVIERRGSAGSGTDQKRRIPWSTYLLLASLTVATMGLSNTAVGYLNYPTAVIFKSCKLIPVLVGGILIQGKRYGALDLLASLCMSVGLVFFTLADSEVSPNFNTYGFVLISLALCADAVIGNVQERAMKQHHESNANVVLFSYSIGFVYILVGEIVFGELLSAFRFCAKHPLETYGYAAVFSATGYVGLHVVLTQVKMFGALIAVTVTSCRKALSIVLSFLIFAKPFTLTYLWSGLVVVVGIQLNVYSNNRADVDARLRAALLKLAMKIGWRSPAKQSDQGVGHEA